MLSATSLVVISGLLASFTDAKVLMQRQAAGREYPAQGAIGPPPLPAWIATYEAAKAAGKLGNYQPATAGADGIPVYGAGVNTGISGICSYTAGQCFAPDDIMQGPANTWALAFDDGPTPVSAPLYTFLQQQNQSATHFMIGGNIRAMQDTYKAAFDAGGHVDSHTWSHQYTTTLSDMQVLGELGWTSQIIFDLSGVIPSFWRPPYGDVDNRVRAIAKEVFGLTTVIWGQDSSDWCLTEGGGSSCGSRGPTTDAELDAEFMKWAAGPKSPGQVILQHERTTRSVGSFLRTYTGIKAAGWNMVPLPGVNNSPWYLNAASNTAPKDAAVSVGEGLVAAAASSNSPASASGSSSRRISGTSTVAASRSSGASSRASSSSRAPTANAAATARPTSGAIKVEVLGWTALAALAGVACSLF